MHLTDSRIWEFINLFQLQQTVLSCLTIYGQNLDYVFRLWFYVVLQWWLQGVISLDVNSFLLFHEMPGANGCRLSTRQPVGQGKGCLSWGGFPLYSRNQFSSHPCLFSHKGPAGLWQPPVKRRDWSSEGKEEKVGGKPFRRPSPSRDRMSVG